MAFMNLSRPKPDPSRQRIEELEREVASLRLQLLKTHDHNHELGSDRIRLEEELLRLSSLTEHLGHFSDSTGIISNWTICINSYDNSS